MLEIFRELDHQLPKNPLGGVVVCDRPQKASLDALTSAGAVTNHECGDRTSDRGHCRAVAGDLHRPVVGTLAAVLSGEGHVPTAFRAYQLFVWAIACVGSTGSESGDGGVHKARIERP